MTQLISSGSAFEKEFAYSRAVVMGQWVFVSGTTGYNYSDMSINDCVVEQTKQCFKNIQEALTQAGSHMTKVVRIKYILPNKNDFKDCAQVIRQYLSNTLPAATMIEAGLIDDAMKIEIEVTALK